MRHVKRKVGLAALLLALSTPALGVPLELTHQGRVFDATDAPLTGTHSVTIRIYAAATGGTALWTETQNAVFEGGYYSIALGTQVSNPLNGDLFDDPVFLAVSIDGGAEIGRQAIRSVPYAIRADVAHSVSGGTVDATEIRIDGDVIVDSSGEWVGVAPDTLAELSCLDRQVARWDATPGEWVCDDDLDNADVIGIVQGAPVTLAAGSTLAGTPLSTLTTSDVRTDLQGSAVSLATGSTVGGTAISTLTTAGVRTDLQGSAVTLATGSTVAGTPISTLTLQGVRTSLQTTAIDLAAGSLLDGEDIVTPLYLETTAVELGAGSTVDGEDIATGPHYTDADAVQAIRDAGGLPLWERAPLVLMDIAPPGPCANTNAGYGSTLRFPTAFPSPPIFLATVDESIDNSGASWSRLQQRGTGRVAIDCNAPSDGLFWLAIEPGAHVIDGKKVEAGRVSSISDNGTVFFTGAHFSAAPIVFVYPEGTNAWARVINTPTAGGFQVQVSTNGQALQWVAFQPGTYQYGPYHFEVGQVAEPDNGDSFSFTSTFKDLPGTLLQVVDTNSSGAAYARLRGISTTSFTIYVDSNASEFLNYLAFEEDR